MSAGARRTRARPEAPVAELDGVGPARSAAFARAGIHTCADLVRFVPRRHVTLRAALPIARLPELPDGEEVTVVARVARASRRPSRRRGGGHLQLVLADGDARLRVTLYNQGWLDAALAPGVRLRVAGRLRRDEPPRIEVRFHERVGEDAQDPAAPRVVAEYPRIEGVPPRLLARLVAGLLEAGVEDPLPEAVRAERGLRGLVDALRGVHAPRDADDLAAGSRRLLHQGFLAAALRVAAAGLEPRGASGEPAIDLAALRARVDRAFPFRFTGAQERAIAEIGRDLASGRPMRRLLQGDVGSGKTAVAIWAALATAELGRQSAVMAPTETLAEQLAEAFAAAAAPLGRTAGLLTGSVKGVARRRLLEAVRAGGIDVLVGTQAMFGEKVEPRDLGLVVVDEQHRFGVMQRLALVRKGPRPHLLGMSATPIPRTLALAFCADLDVSTLDERPPGRRPVATRLHVRDRDGAFDWDALAERARAGEKTFIVFPAVESDANAVASVLHHGRAIARRHFRGVRVAALHGRMNDAEKRENLRRFRDGDVQVLFATTVIEVGIDVPDARTIVIVDADRFGLAQLHQLRGRVGRGGEDGRCHLLVRRDPGDEASRLAFLEGCSDGFLIAERDLELRGPGDMMGLRQHGIGPLELRVDEDRALMEAAFEDARALIAAGHDAAALAAELERWTPPRRRRGVALIDAG